MTERISIGDEAPDFDLSSTEGVLLMLRDEVPRTSVLIYFFDDPSAEVTRHDLAELAGRTKTLAAAAVKVFGVSPSKMPPLQSLQADLGLPFPLLRDDRAFSEAYGVAPSTEEQSSPPALCLVDRCQKVVWMANPAGSVTDALVQIEAMLEKQDSPTSNYPKSVINRLVDLWVN